MTSAKNEKQTSLTLFPSKVGGIHRRVLKNLERRGDLKGKKVLDCPAGDGRTSYVLQNLGADVHSGDLFPEFFKPKNIECKEVDIIQGLPYPDGYFDFVICQEGIEHFSDQLFVLKEFARVLKKGGELLITTPNVSHLRAKLSFLAVESEYYKRSAPSEMDGIWFSHRETQNLYFGHIFLINNQKLRTLAILAGLRIHKHHWTDLGSTSLLLFPFLFPLVLFLNLFPPLFYRKHLKNVLPQERSRILKEQFLLNISLKTLVCKHTMLSLQKTHETDEAVRYLKDLTRHRTGHES